MKNEAKKGSKAVELYKNDYYLILKSLEFYIYLIQNFSFMMRLNSEQKELFEYDIKLLYERLNTIYVNYYVDK